MARKIVGLDIGTTAVRVAELSVRRGRVVLDRLGQHGLPQGAVVVRLVDLPWMLGTITVNGVTAQQWRGPVGTSGGTGYLKSYGDDSRLQFASPPFAMDLSQAPFRVNQWAGVQNPTGPPA